MKTRKSQHTIGQKPLQINDSQSLQDIVIIINRWGEQSQYLDSPVFSAKSTNSRTAIQAKCMRKETIRQITGKYIVALSMSIIYGEEIDIQYNVCNQNTQQYGYLTIRSNMCCTLSFLSLSIFVISIKRRFFDSNSSLVLKDKQKNVPISIASLIAVS